MNPWIFVESCPGLICQTLCDVPGFWFSRTIGFGLAGAAALASPVLLRVVEVLAGAAVPPDVIVFVVESNRRGMPIGMGGSPEITWAKSICELCDSVGL